MTYPDYDDPAKPVSLSWAPGERLLVSTGTNPVCRLDDQPTLPAPYLTMFLAAHSVFQYHNSKPFDSSHHYLTLITRCLDQLSALAIDAPSLKAELAPLVSATRETKLTWHFIHAIYLATSRTDSTDGHVSQFLSAWYKENCLDLEEETNSTLLAYEDDLPNGSPNFWRTLTDLVLQADLVTALKILSAHIARHNSADQWASAIANMQDPEEMKRPGINSYSSPIILFEAVLSNAPRHTISSRSDRSWYIWQRKCAKWMDDPILADCDPARKLLRAIVGHPSDIANVSTSWQQMFMACSTYMTDRVHEGGNFLGGPEFISDICAAASNYFESPVHISDGALVEAASGNIAEAIVRLEASAPSSWYAAHLCDLLVSANLMNDNLDSQWKVDDNQIGMREFYIKEYARGLERYSGCWRIAVDYIMQCPTHGPSMLIDMLLRVPITGMSDPIVEKTLLVCEKKNLRKTHSAICEKLGSMCLHHDNLGGAMAWYLRTNLYKQAQNVAQIALQQAQQQGLNSPGSRSLECVETALKSFGDQKTKTALAYTSCYRDMLDARSEITAARNAGDRAEMKTRAVDFIESVRTLIRGDGLPRKYWCVVVFETAKVLELYPEVLQEVPRSALLELMGALELASGPNSPSELTENLRCRLLFEARAAANSDTVGPEPRLPAAKVDDALDHCRNVFLNCIAAKLT